MYYPMIESFYHCLKVFVFLLFFCIFLILILFFFYKYHHNRFCPLRHKIPFHNTCHTFYHFLSLEGCFCSFWSVSNLTLYITLLQNLHHIRVVILSSSISNLYFAPHFPQNHVLNCCFSFILLF